MALTSYWQGSKIYLDLDVGLKLVTPCKVLSYTDKRNMSEAVIVTFQTQLSNVLETILKSAMYEITRLVEDSLLEEVGRGKQEVELLRRRLQLSELKVKEREWEKSRRGKCTDCERSIGPNDESQPGVLVTAVINALPVF